MALDDVKLLLGIKDDSRDDLLNLLIKNATTQVLGRLQELELPPAVVPNELAYIIPELVIARYNKIGSEGMESHTVEGETNRYRADDLIPYEKEIERYLNTVRTPETGAVFFR